jgi:hypothetical protein
MAKEEEQHACILNACRAMIENYDEQLDPRINPAKAAELTERLSVYLSRGTASLGMEEAFRIALEIESSEIDVIYGKLLQLGGPKVAKTMENLGIPASAQRLRLKLALRQFCSSQELLNEAERL